jgi:hypothetical protein
MENFTVNNSNVFNNYKSELSGFSRDSIYSGNMSHNSTSIYLLADGDENFLDYLNSRGIRGGSDLLVLPSNYHYFYDRKDLRGIKTVINLRELNYIKDLNAFLYNLHFILPADASLFGRFSAERTDTIGDLLSTFINRFNNFIDLRTFHSLGKKEVQKLMEIHGFRISDLSETDGSNYFHSQNNCPSSRPAA